MKVYLDQAPDVSTIEGLYIYWNYDMIDGWDEYNLELEMDNTQDNRELLQDILEAVPLDFNLEVYNYEALENDTIRETFEKISVDVTPWTIFIQLRK